MEITLEQIKKLYQENIGPHIKEGHLTKETANNIYREMFNTPDINSVLWSKNPNSELKAFELIQGVEELPFTQEDLDQYMYSGHELYHALDTQVSIEGYRIFVLNEPNQDRQINERTIIIKHA